MSKPETPAQRVDPYVRNRQDRRESPTRHHQLESQRRPMITPPMRTGITTQFARQPTVIRLSRAQMPRLRREITVKKLH